MCAGKDFCTSRYKISLQTKKFQTYYVKDMNILGNDMSYTSSTLPRNQTPEKEVSLQIDWTPWLGRNVSVQSKCLISEEYKREGRGRSNYVLG